MCRFCIYATICVATNFAVLATFFLATFVLTERRMAANRLDCCCCVTSSKPSGFAVDAVSDSAEKGAKLPSTLQHRQQHTPQFTTGCNAPSRVFWSIPCREERARSH